jgi:Cdc6-like AAA superfamily ATPase
MDRLNMVSGAFSPGAPIDQWELFAGRLEQTRDVIVALNQKGQHVILYGERGVGKTSLANVVQFIHGKHSSFEWGCVTINSDASDNFSSLWHKLFREMTAVVKMKRIGFGHNEIERQVSLRETLPENVTPDDIRYALQQFPKPALIIIDEIDTIPDKNATAMLAHTIKSLSDHAITSKIILVGVADSVEELISEHRSVERSLVQVRMPRMSREELFELLDKALLTAAQRRSNFFQ